MAADITGEQEAEVEVPEAGFASFAQFWPYYVSEHRRVTTRALHFVGSTLVLALATAAIVTGRPWLFALCPLAGYGFAWVGHFGFEHNRPATFRHPLYSFIGDWVMYGKILTGTMRAEVERVSRKRDPQ